MDLDITDYTNKAQDLLEDGRTYRDRGGISDNLYKRCTPQGQWHLNLIDNHKFTRGNPLRSIDFSSGFTTYEAVNDLVRILRPLIGNSPITSKIPEIFITSPRDCTPSKWMFFFIWFLCTFYICVYRLCHYHHKKKTWTRSRAPCQNIHVSRADNQPIRVLFEDHVFPVSRQVFWTGINSSHGVSHQPNCGQPLYGGLWN